jgi:hypothetical protein
MALDIGNIAPLTLEGIRKLTGDAYKRYELEYTNFTNVNKATKGVMFDREVATIGALTLKPENAPIVVTDPRVGRVRNYPMFVFAGAVRASWEAETDDLYGFIRRNMQALGKAANETENIEVANLINLVTSATLPGFDGLSLLHDTHTNLDGSDTLTYKDNLLGTQDISESSLREALAQFETIRDAAGNRVQFGRSYKIIHSTADMFLLQELLRSSAKVAVEYSAGVINVLNGAFTPFLSHYQTDTDQWLVQAEEHDMNFFRRVAPVVDSYDDKATLSTVNTIADRFGYGFGDWRPCMGSLGV